MRNHGTEDRQAGDGSRFEEAVTVHGSRPHHASPDLVFDFSDLERMRVQDLSVMLTARQMANDDDRTVWATGVPMHTWRTLHAMGLGEYFKAFPSPDVEEA